MLVIMKGSRKVSVNCSRVWMVLRASSTASGLNRLNSLMMMKAATAEAYLEMNHLLLFPLLLLEAPGVSLLEGDVAGDVKVGHEAGDLAAGHLAVISVIHHQDGVSSLSKNVMLVNHELDLAPVLLTKGGLG